MVSRVVICLSLLAGIAANEVTPIEKVITLIEGLQTEVETDSKAEAKAYEEFSCFCKDTTDTKVKSVNKAHDDIDVNSADIGDKTAEREDDKTDLTNRKKDQERLSAELQETTERCAKEKAEYEAEEADLSKAIQGLKDAIKAMTDSKPAALIEFRKNLGKTFEMAEAMDLLKTKKHKAVAAFIQQSAGVDPEDPEFKFHSNDIIEVCDNLLVEYKGSKKDLDDEWAKTKKNCEDTIKTLKDDMKTNKDAMEALDKKINRLAKEIAQHREDLINAQSQMQDDELYIKDLTKRCEDRANDYDQRSAMRDSELSALSEALDVLKDRVKGRADEVNIRALLVQKASAPVENAKVTMKATAKAISFLQGASVIAEGREATKQKALDVLRQAGHRLQSLTLLSLAERASADPFKKVKGLIQALIERLLTEAKNEATKKGFCDTELGKARKDRDFRYNEAGDLSAELAGLEAKRDALEEEISQLQKDIKAETQALKETTKEREDEKKANMKTLKTAKEGFEAVSEALLILRSFYKQAAKAAAFVQASPVDEDTAGAGFSGNYKGKQGGMKAVFALLETLASDFDRTLRKTEEAEHTAHRDFVEFDQAAKSSIAGKTTKEDLDQQDLTTTQTSIKTKTSDLKTAVNLLDKALEEIEELKPVCIDTGMSYAERVEKREEEIEALENALIILAPPDAVLN